ncbi:MAG TPA: cob(I)yrinic acid a c-diamide adenosyltransferase [Lachnospiraceae bacterium]|nr:cob(I)yrinic acid a c-diamide adenosyltransferase [Lachnospiraceae bacterium]
MAGKIVVYTGNGKGKSSAALGKAIQYACRGKQVAMVQFLKGREEPDVTEFMKRLEPEIRIFRFERSDEAFDRTEGIVREEEKQNIRNGFNYARKVLDTGESDLLVMDEVLGLVDNRIITMDELKSLMERRGDTDVILTGILMDDKLCTFADEIYEISAVQFRNFTENASADPA